MHFLTAKASPTQRKEFPEHCTIIIILNYFVAQTGYCFIEETNKAQQKSKEFRAFNLEEEVKVSHSEKSKLFIWKAAPQLYNRIFDYDVAVNLGFTATSRSCSDEKVRSTSFSSVF